MNAKARATLHIARPDDAPPQVRQLEHESDEHFVKRCASIHALGVRWQLHARYESPLRHSVHEAIWRPERASFLAAIATSAAAARARNPAHRAWVRVRVALGGLQ